MKITSMRSRRRRAFTLLEVLVASTIMAIAVGTIFAALSTSLSTASRVTARDQAALQAKRILDDLLANTTLPRGQQLQGHLNTAQYGMEADWRALVSPMESAPGGWAVDRVALELVWRAGGKPGSIQLDGYRTARMGVQ
jgi:general secretion pathway protein I